METTRTTTDRRRPLDFLAIAIATAGGAGLVPKAPGTAGAAVGVLVFVLMVTGGLGRFYLHAIILAIVIGTWAASCTERTYGHDSQRIVVDEVAGQMIAYAMAANSAVRPSTLFIILGFGLFRFFDIAKPFPLRRLEKLPGGFGVMADDIGAGLYTLGVLTLLKTFL